MPSHAREDRSNKAEPYGPTSIGTPENHPSADSGILKNDSDKNHPALGSLVKRLQALADVLPDLQKLIGKAVVRRNFLAHHFFRERAADFVTTKGRDRMLAELRSDCALFDDANQSLSAFIEPYRKRLGISDEAMRLALERYLAEQSRSADELSL